MVFIFINLCLLNAIFFRLRGSAVFRDWTGRGVTTARLLWAGHLALTAWALGGFLARDGWWALALGLALWLGSVWPWRGTLGVRTWQEVIGHSWRGMEWTAPAAIVVAVWTGSLPAAGWIMLAGVACGPVYLLSRLASPRKAVELAELVWGSMIAISVLFRFNN